MIPKCCGNKMEIRIENRKFLEVQCASCGDVIFVKKENAASPQLLDD